MRTFPNLAAAEKAGFILASAVILAGDPANAEQHFAAVKDLTSLLPPGSNPSFGVGHSSGLIVTVIPEDADRKPYFHNWKTLLKSQPVFLESLGRSVEMFDKMDYEDAVELAKRRIK